jgi:hypothetical protein
MVQRNRASGKDGKPRFVNGSLGLAKNGLTNDRQVMKTLTSLRFAETNLRSIVEAALEESGCLLRLAP